ncbi:Transcription initiation factor IIB [Spatholobus suberectus]|nr:Transcription initiation factor IIB [Spatholobus suberectus]
MADEEYCSDCKTYTPSVYDHNAGDTICSECGLVLESRSIDQAPEWGRLYCYKEQDDDNDDDDYKGSRVTDPFNPLLLTSGASLGTLIADPPSSDNNNNMVPSVNQWEITNDRKDCNLISALRTMEQMANNLGLVWTIRNHAKELYKKAEEGRIFGRYRNPRAYIVACLYLACQEEGFPRTLKEIHTVAEGVKVKEINKAVRAFKKHLEVGRNYDKTTHAKDMARRFCSNLGLDNRVINAVKEVVQKSQELDVRRNPTSILAATIYMVTQLSENKIHFRAVKEVAQACKVAEGTLKKVYKDLYPLASVLIPNWYANVEDIKRLVHSLKLIFQ